MKTLSMAWLLLFVLFPHEKVTIAEPLNNPSDNIPGKKVTVYTTAANTNLRLSVTDTLHFKESNQPLETEISIFVNPAHTFQNFLGIGGAITDASAETFAKLSKAKQEELITAYYD